METVWSSLIEKEITQKYWGRENRSDWKQGSIWEHIRTDGSNAVDIHGQVIECIPPKKLVVTWNALETSTTHEPAPSLVTYEMLALGPDTRLTVTHSLLNKDSVMHNGVTQGWQAVLSNLKTVLETGKPLSSHLWGEAEPEHPDDGY
ncbi:SRPBCC domain-containing protein [Litorimonas taeanensis]|uniref:SRPBCC domain-containing protein n=1 Tax=Litorimonas taeanensis TaxID=568099 RepID=UPI002279548E|nr:SRPBCC domain-containing protein [Litorimonas taeanensis]